MSADGTRERPAVKTGTLVESGTIVRKGVVAPFLRSLRLHQWAKNLLIFVPLVLAGKLLSVEAWTNCVVGFLAFGLLASATYLVNDLRDLPYDRLHWSKRARPLACGDLSAPMAYAAIAVGTVASFAIAASLGSGAVLILFIYGALTLMYSIQYLLNEAFAHGFYKSPLVLWALPAALFLWLGRFWLFAGRDALDDDPLVYAIKDRVSLGIGAAMIAIFVAAWQL
jgi:hypothetical protein